ncbi:mRNA triphosphatase CET1 [Melanomma pulvis-pyrius CBS 109.77]|uniref:mRNA-capping enzyme subunit beta n=1 Tax=Melanomma pulvis-pyrius CBS 109.77 TaxID=1314802 RepID=A0A6A6X1I8_9PLEO|nr:mRNA triphosphatase CET1 [Melanomma pulvis-pyrius CBS 109.77]
MNIAALVNPVPEAPRRSLSNTHSVSAPSPVTSAAKLPTPPSSTHNQMLRKRKRHDPKPIWAVLEHEVIEGEQEFKRLQLEQRQQSRPPPPPHSQSQSRPPPSVLQRNGPASSGPSPFFGRQLIGYERPISDDPQVYDEMARQVCDFLWLNVVDNASLRSAIAESPDTEVEIEARWGQIQDRQTGRRLVSVHDTECVLKSHVAESTKFESTMSIQQHKKMNEYLNRQVQDSRREGTMRSSVNYKHTHEVDMFYDLDRAGYEQLPPLTRHLIANSGRQRVRVTRDAKTNQVIRKIIKHRVANLEISSPKTEWDYRIGINLEIMFPGDIETLIPVVENGKTLESMERKKDRVSYSWLGAYQIDLTQVSQGQSKNHELELELNGEVMLRAAENVKEDPSDFEGMITGMLNNLRVLSREVTPAVPI